MSKVELERTAYYVASMFNTLIEKCWPTVKINFSKNNNNLEKTKNGDKNDTLSR
jgi:hypothetical protein